MRKKRTPEQNQQRAEKNRLYLAFRYKTDPLYREKNLQDSRRRNAALRKDPIAWRGAAIKSAKFRAKKYNLPFDLDISDVIVPEICPILGIKLVFGHSKGCQSSSPSLDRIVPSKGYVRGNVVVISFRANRLKCDCVDPVELRAVADFIEISAFAEVMRRAS